MNSRVLVITVVIAAGVYAALTNSGPAVVIAAFLIGLCYLWLTDD